MGFTLSQNKFKSAEFIFSKIKRELKSLGAVNQIDDTDFPLYVAEVLKELGCGTYKEADAILTVVDGKATLPKDFMYIYAAYKCNKCTDEVNIEHYQKSGSFYIANDITCEVLGRTHDCELDCGEYDKVIQKVTVRQYVGNTCCRTRTWDDPCLLTISPNVREFCTDDSPNLHCSNMNEITISNGCLLTNFKSADIYLQYYAFPIDENNVPMIPDITSVEKAVEWYIKYQLFLNYWFDGSVTDIQNKWGKAEQMYEAAMANARFDRKIPSFQQMINSARMQRTVNKVAFFGQMNPKR